MAVTLRRNFPPLTDMQLVTREDWAAVGRLARERIIRRTVQGQGVNGPFAPYSPKYAERKAQELGSASPVNLMVSGEMLRAIVDRVGLTFGA
jgi:hypothetical protein